MKNIYHELVNFKKLALKMTLLFLFYFIPNHHLKAQTYTYRIQEVSVNPNCGGYYCVRTGGSCISATFQYSYPSPINRVLPGAPQNCYTYTGSLPNEILFLNVNLCNSTSFTVPLTGAATSIRCNCTGTFAMHNFSATIGADPSGLCDYLITVYY
jgi:hypothetical protein